MPGKNGCDDILAIRPVAQVAHLCKTLRRQHVGSLEQIHAVDRAVAASVMSGLGKCLGPRLSEQPSKDGLFWKVSLWEELV